jgi:hypothetical protein
MTVLAEGNAQETIREIFDIHDPDKAHVGGLWQDLL